MNRSTSENIMVGASALHTSLHPASWERRIIRLVRRVHAELGEIAAAANDAAGGDDRSLRYLRMGLIDHVIESGILLYREGASTWSDSRILDEAMRQAPRLCDPELLSQFAEVSAWFVPTESARTRGVLHRLGGATPSLPHILHTRLKSLPDALRAHALMLAWTQVGQGTLPLDAWREMFVELGFTHDGRSESRPEGVPTLYRTAAPEGSRGWSWTSSLAFARYFQRMNGASDIWVLEGVPSDAILARFDSRGEAEWVIDMDKVDASPVPMLRREPSPTLAFRQTVASPRNRQAQPKRLSKAARAKAARTA